GRSRRPPHRSAHPRCPRLRRAVGATAILPLHLRPRSEPSMSSTPMDKPSVLFVCVHNAGRSQMAAGFLRELGGGRIEVRSAGSAPADTLNPVAVDAMRELDIDITRNSPALLDADTVRTSDVVITMGCGDTCPIFPGKRYED